MPVILQSDEPNSLVCEHIKGTLQRNFQANGSRHQDVRLPSLNLLNRPDVEVGQFSQPLLGHVLGHSLASDIGTEVL